MHYTTGQDGSGEWRSGVAQSSVEQSQKAPQSHAIAPGCPTNDVRPSPALASVAPSGPVAYLTPLAKGYGAVCREHRDPRARNTPLYHVNVYPYVQRCATCGVTLVAGAKGWPELFDGSR